ncbi:MAG: hypothetical protein J2P59_07805 [Acidimicrobiales bacterium]|nr:hypothetical protein [Acidimicrobiales bacterium]
MSGQAPGGDRRHGVAARSEDRYVVLGLAPSRARWFRAVAQWANAGSLPVEFVKCLSGEELRVRLHSARPYSAALIDAGVTALDRDLVDLASRVDCAVLVVDRRQSRRDWAAIGASVVLPEDLDAPELLAALRAAASPVTTGDPTLEADLAPRPSPDPPPGSIIALCGSGGTGVSTLSVALAQGLHDLGPILLADLARRAQQALLHDAGDVIPGIQELAEAHRVGRLAPDEVVGLAFDVPQRGYHLVLGLRRPQAWSTLRPRAFEAGLDSLRRAYRVVVCDTDADLEGESDGGSLDVEERNLMARTAISRAALVLAVGLPGLKGLHSLVQVLSDLATFGIPGERVLPVVNRAPRSPRARSEIKETLCQLSSPMLRSSMLGPLFLPDRGIEEALSDGSRLPGALVDPLASSARAALARAPGSVAPDTEPRPVRPGSLGRWAEESS